MSRVEECVDDLLECLAREEAYGSRLANPRHLLSPIGHVPSADQIDLDGLDSDNVDVKAALTVDVEEWKAEVPLIEEWFDKIGVSLPASMRDELEALKLRLGR